MNYFYKWIIVISLFFAAPIIGNAWNWSGRNAGIAVPKPIPAFNSKSYTFLSGMFAVETRDLSSIHRQRGLILWIDIGSKNEMKEEYVSCPDKVVGSCYSGLIYASLVDLSTHKLIQTLFFNMEGLESSSVPFRIPEGGFYSVRGNKNALGEKETVLLDPVRIDGDKNSEEYALFETIGGCFCPAVFAYGYDAKKDKLFQIKVNEYSYHGNVVDQTESESLYDLFFFANRKPGEKIYEFVTKEGHGSEVFTIHRYKYDFELRKFYGISVDLPDDDKNNREYLDKSGYHLTSKAHRYLDKWWKNINPQPKRSEKGFTSVRKSYGSGTKNGFK